MKQFLLLLITLLLFTNYQKADTIDISIDNNNPKLVIGIVVDQMRYDYLTRFEDKYGDGGFKRMMTEGYNLKNTHYNYTPTKTAPGHTSIYTGTTPQNHGIMGNDWYDKYEKKSVHNSTDRRYTTVGASSGGNKSPHRIQTTTIGDQLHLHQSMNGKVIGIGIKVRSAVLPGGHTANAAYWYEGGNIGKWITSTYYMEELPKWVDEFNNSGLVDDYLSKPWNTYYDIETYTESIADDNRYEEKFNGEDTPTFPHDLPNLRDQNGNYSLIKETPFGNSMITDFALATIKAENLGKSEHIDFLTIGYSSSDSVGHRFGVAAKETEDTYIRLDKDLERLFQYLDAEVGEGNYTLFLTGDHGVTDVPNYLKDNKIPAGYRSSRNLIDYIKEIAEDKFGDEKLIEHVENDNIFLNKKKLKELKLDRNHVAQTIADELINYEIIYKTVTARTLQTTGFTEGTLRLVQNGYNQKFSGDIIYVLKPSIISNGYEKKGGTNHASGYSYDTHVPLLFYGNGIKKGSTNKYYPIVDIAPTISALLGIEFPNGTTGKVIDEVLE